MAADSLIGGTTVATTLGTTLLGVIEGVLGDMQGSTIVSTTLGAGTLVSGLGANNEAQGALIPASSAITGILANGVFSANVNLPSNVGITFEGLNTVSTGAAVKTYLNNFVNLQVPITTAAGLALSNSLKDAISSVLGSSTANSVVRVMSIVDNNSTSAAGTEVKLTGSATGSEEVVALNMNQLKVGKTLVVENMDKVVVIGAGTVKVDGNQSTKMAGDLRNQVMTGGGGADTLVGGGGSDTLTGGLGNNTFGISGIGKVTITDFKATDKIAFNLPGITSFTQLKAALAKTEFTGGNLIATFHDGTVVTLVGVNPTLITSSLFDFTIS